MRKVILRPEAEADIEEVADYTIGEWGHEQARDLRKAIEALAVSALRNPLLDRIFPGLRRKRSGMHHIYYVATDDVVDVLKVIHAQRDPALHLRVETWGDEGEG